MTTTRTQLNINFNDKEAAKQCGAIWDSKNKKWTTNDIKTFNNSFEYVLKHKPFLNETYYDLEHYIIYNFMPWEGTGEITPTDEEKEQFKIYAFNVKCINQDKTKFYVFCYFMRQDDITTLNKVKFKNFYDLHLINRRHYKYNFNIDPQTYIYDKPESITDNNLFFSKKANAEKYKFFDMVSGFKFEDYKKNNISKEQIKSIYNIIKHFKDEGDDGVFINRWWNHTKDNFFKSFHSSFFKYALYINTGLDPLTQKTHIIKDVANIIYDYMK